VSTLPADDVAVVITVEPDPPELALAVPPAAAPDAGELAVAELLPLPLEHAAASTATAAAPPTSAVSLAAVDMRIHTEFPI
jgi:hypothetical protein